jgi:hypothetical protein
MTGMRRQRFNRGFQLKKDNQLRQWAEIDFNIYKEKAGKIIIAVIVYNRFENLKRWIHCWERCEQLNAELIIIHNYDIGTDFSAYKNYCAEKNIKYIPRINKGFDIGAFQDVCRNRLNGFDNDWDTMLWVTDDTLPMYKYFLPVFLHKLNEQNVGVSCMEISPVIALHIRTTGFCLKKNTADKLIFPSDPIITKDECYNFEHRGGNRTLLGQINSMGLKAEMVSDISISPLWDSGYSPTTRKKEHELAF